MIRRRSLLLATPALLAATRSRAAEAVKVGVLYPLTGNSAAAGQMAKSSVEVGIDIINNPPADLKDAIAGAGRVKIDPIYVDHHGDPSVMQSETQRLITIQRVSALIGSYQSSTAMVGTAVAERHGVPFVVSDSVADNITGRGFKFTFRVTPIGRNFAETYMRFIGDMKKAGHTINTIAMVNENTDYGTSLGDAVVAAAKAANLPVAIRIPYNANGTDVSAQVLQLKQANPSLIVFSSYTSDAILYMKTFKSLDYLPPMIIGDDGGFSDPSFIPAVGSLAQGAISRSAWSLGAPGSLSYRVNQVFKAKTGRDMDDVSGRCMEALFVLADALVRAGSPEPAKIQAALRATNLGRDQMIVGYEGVKFDATGQNVLGSTYITQLQGTSYATVWPPAEGNPPIAWPMKGWR